MNQYLNITHRKYYVESRNVSDLSYKSIVSGTRIMHFRIVAVATSVLTRYQREIIIVGLAVLLVAEEAAELTVVEYP